MKKYLASSIAALLLTSGAIAGSATAQDMYDDPYVQQPRSNVQNLDNNANRNVDRMSTGSIHGNRTWMNHSGSDTNIDGSQDTGDYYDGVLRPQD